MATENIQRAYPSQSDLVTGVITSPNAYPSTAYVTKVTSNSYVSPYLAVPNQHNSLRLQMSEISYVGGISLGKTVSMVTYYYNDHNIGASSGWHGTAYFDVSPSKQVTTSIDKANTKGIFVSISSYSLNGYTLSLWTTS